MKHSQLRQFIKEANAAKLSPVEKDVFQYYHSLVEELGFCFIPDMKLSEAIYRSRNAVCYARKTLTARGWIKETGLFNIEIQKIFGDSPSILLKSKTAKTTDSEFSIQNALHTYRNSLNHRIIIPNVKFLNFNGEIDLLSVTKAGLVYEHEIKISKSDFRADFKHKIYKHFCFKNSKDFTHRIPNYFYYVCPQNLIQIEEIPEYAGLIYVGESVCRKIKAAPRLHSRQIGEDVIEKLANRFMRKYWNLRKGY